MPLGEQFTPELQAVNQTPSADVCLCLSCPPCLCCMWMSVLLGRPGRAAFGVFILLLSSRTTELGPPLPRAGGCCSMQGFVLWGWWLHDVERGGMNPLSSSLPTVVPEMPSARGVPVRVPSLRDHPEELRCSPSSSSSSPLPARGRGAGPVCMSPLHPAEEPAPGPQKQSRCSHLRGAGEGRGDPPSLHPCANLCE